MKREDFKRSPCPIAVGLDHVGDRWTLLVVRNAVNGARRFGDFAAMPERIPTNILADRLKHLERTGLMTRRLYQERPARWEYLLTPKGADLVPVLQEVARWSRAHEPETWAPAEAFWRLRPGDVAAED